MSAVGRSPRPAVQRAVIGRLLQSTDFERALGSPARVRSTHFAVHFAAPAATPAAPELSTGDVPVDAGPVDDSPSAVRLGAVVPKRHARRSVTRTLLKRRIRAAAARHAHALVPGDWVVRLRLGFDVARFPSAASDALRAAADAELDTLLARLARPAA